MTQHLGREKLEHINGCAICQYRYQHAISMGQPIATAIKGSKQFEVKE